MIKKTATFRFSEIDKALLKLLSERLGINQTAVMKLAIRRLAEQEHISTQRVKQEHV